MYREEERCQTKILRMIAYNYNRRCTVQDKGKKVI